MTIREYRILTIFRLSAVTVILGGAIYYFKFFFEKVNPFLIYYLFGLTALIYVISIGLWFSIRSLRFPKFAAYLIVALDAAVYTSLIFVSGGLRSPFTFLYVFTIIGSLPALKLKGAFFAALVSTIFYAFVGVLQYEGALSPLESIMIFVEGEELPKITFVEVIFRPFFTGLFLFFIAAVSGFLAERISSLHIEVESVKRMLRQARVDTKLILEQMPSGVAVFDLNGHILFFNRSGKELLKLSKTPRNIEDLEKETPLFYRLISRIIHKSNSLGNGEIEQEIRIKDSPKIFHLRWSNIEGGGIKGIVLVFEDITESRKLTEELKEKEKLAEIGRISGIITHEIKTAATILKTAAELIASGTLDEDSVAKVKEILKKGSSKLSRILSNLMGFIKEDSLDIREVELEKFLKEIVSSYSLLGLTNAQIKFNFNGPQRVKIDVLKFESIIRNLIENAIDAVKHSEKPEIEIGTIPPGTKIKGIESEIEVEPGYFGVYVKDNGVGIEESVRNSITKPFFSTKSKGLGMGLTLSLKFVEAHKGELVLDSKPGVGSMFVVIIPLDIS